MVKTGITRRIDELGRLVIPKEIRKNLKIKDNDQVEINVTDNKIILSKYDLISKDKIISNMLSCLKKMLNKNIVITSRDKIVDVSLINKEMLKKISLTDEVINIIETRVVNLNKKIKEFIYNIFPLIINGDLYGSLIVISNITISDNEKGIIEFSKMFLENYLE